MKIFCLTLLLASPLWTLEQTTQTASKTITFSDADFANVVGTTESITAEPKIITQRFAAEPKIITERTLGKPHTITESYVEPLRQKVVLSPSIRQKVEHLIPDYRQEMDQYVQSNSALPVQTSYENAQKTVTIDGDQKFYQTIYQPKLNKVTEQLRVVEGGQRSQTLEPIIKPAQTQHQVNVVKVEVPANKFVNQPVIQPIFEREHLKVQFADGKDTVSQAEPIVRDAVVQERVREQTIEKPGDFYFKQDVIRPYITKEHVQVQFNEAAPSFKQNEKIEAPVQQVQQNYTLQHQFAIPVDDQRLVATPAKVAYDIPVHHYQYVPIYSQGCIPCCGCIPEPSDEQLAAERIQKDRWNEVLRKFGQKYGRDTFDGSLLHNVGEQKQVIPYQQVAAMLGPQIAYGRPHFDNKHYYAEELEDPEGWDWVQTPQNWIIANDQNKAKWGKYYKGKWDKDYKGKWNKSTYGEWDKKWDGQKGDWQWKSGKTEYAWGH